MRAVISVFLVISCFITFGQVTEMPYKGGEMAFYMHFSKLKFPDKSRIGVAILYWEVVKGEIQHARIINSLSETLDEEIIRMLKLTEGNWVPNDSTYEFRLPIIFNSSGKAFYIDPFPENYLEEVVVSTFGYSYSFPSDKKLRTKLKKNIENKGFQEALKQLDEIIRRNPFHAQVRDLRIFCLNTLQKFDLACQDLRFLENELNVKSKYPCIEP